MSAYFLIFLFHRIYIKDESLNVIVVSTCILNIALQNKFISLENVLEACNRFEKLSI